MTARAYSPADLPESWHTAKPPKRVTILDATGAPVISGRLLGSDIFGRRIRLVLALRDGSEYVAEVQVPVGATVRAA